MNIQQLRHLIALHETGSFSRAAKQLHVTQPALSRSVQGLEQELGMVLLDRVGKRNEFTTFGHTVLTRAKRIVFEIDELKRSAQLLREGATGSLHVGMGPGPAAIFLRPILKRFAHAYPKIQLNVAEGSSEALIDQLERKLLDAVVVDSRVVPPSRALTVEQLPDMAAGCLCRSGHPLLLRERVDIQQLAEYPVAGIQLSSEIARIFVERHGPAAHPDTLFTLRCDSIPTLLRVAHETDAVYVGVYAAALELLTCGDLVKLAIKPSLEAAARFGVVSMAGRTRAPALELMQRMLIDEAADVQAQLLGLIGRTGPSQNLDS